MPDVASEDIRGEPEGDPERSDGRTSGSGGDIASLRVDHEKRDARSSRPQSFVKSHQNEYNELMAAANSLKDGQS